MKERLGSSLPENLVGPVSRGENALFFYLRKECIIIISTFNLSKYVCVCYLIFSEEV